MITRRRLIWASVVLAVVLTACWAASALFVADVGVVLGQRRVRARVEGGAYIVETEVWTAADVLASGNARRWAEIRRPYPRGPGDPGTPWTWGLGAQWHHAGVRLEVLSSPFSPQLPDTLAVAGWWPVVLAVGAAVWLARPWRRAAAGACGACGYSLAGLAPGAKCPECGNGE